MIKWLQKSLIVAVALLTFGVITPAHDIWSGFQDKNDMKHAEGPIDESTFQVAIADPLVEVQVDSIEDTFVSSARELSYEKFGDKIGPVIANEFDDVIFPKIDEVIRLTLNEANDLHKKRLAISERPTGNYSEKIFHVFDEETREDLIRFHVRTDKRPLDGYFFNFHYHLATDEFTAHHTLGDIYWSKNTPPKWLS